MMTRAEQAYLEIKELKKSGIDVGDFDYISEYSSPDRDSAMTSRRHSLETGLCHKLLLTLPVRNATKDELLRVVKYYIVALDGIKWKLDWKKAKADLGIDELRKKYF